MNRTADEYIYTDMYVVSDNKRISIDDPKQRQRYTKYMTANEKERFAKWYIRSLLEAKEKVLWFRRMTDPSLHKDIYESGGVIPLGDKPKKAINYDHE
jgi:hypothetical protein